MDSTRAYQGYGGGCDPGFIDALEKAIVGSTRPNLTLVFDLDPVVGLARARERGDAVAEDRYERKVTRRIKGSQVTRNGDADNPAYLIVQDDGDEVLKLASELRPAG